MEILKSEQYAEERRVLERLAKQNDGLLMVEHVLAEAQNPQSVLHKHFQWDNDKAAEAYRKAQARTLIQKVTITIEKAPDVHIRAFVSLSTDQQEKGGYRMTANVLSDDNLKGQLLHDMQLALVKWKKQISLLDGETEEILDRLDQIVTRNIKHRQDKHKQVAA